MFVNKKIDEFDPLQEYKKKISIKEHPRPKNDKLDIDNFIEHINTSTHLINNNLPETDIKANHSLYNIAKTGLAYINDKN
jgi:hypothetical protein